MYIERLVIKGFGKIVNITVNLKRGLNVFYGENESGKTTVQWFIKGMLFGLKGGRASKEGALPPLRRYKPWRCDVYGGILEYRLDDGKAYRVERDFEEGSMKLFDSQLNDITGVYSVGRSKNTHFAEKQLGLNEECFNSTAFIGQMQTKIYAEGSRELLNRLVNISQTGFESISYQRADKALRDALKEHVGTEKTSTRPMDRVNERLESLRKAKSSLKEERESLLATQVALDEAENEKARLEARKDMLEEVKRLIDIKKDIIRNNKVCGILRKNLKDVQSREKMLQQALLSHGNTGSKDRRESPVNYALAVFTAIAVLFCAAGFIISTIFFIGTAAAALIILVSVLLKINAGKKQGQRTSEIIMLKDELNDILSRLSAECGVHIKDYSSMQAALDGIDYRTCDMEHNLNASVQRMGEKWKESNNGMYGYSDETANLIDNLGLDLTASDISRMEEVWEYDYDNTCSSMSTLSLRIKEYETLLRGIPDNEEIQRVEEEIAGLEETKNSLAELELALKTAIDVLAEAAEEIQEDFVPRLNKRMGEIIGRITGGHYRDLRTDDRLCLKTILPETESVCSALDLSGGTVDQMYFALRLAALELIEENGEKLPVIMDEAFAQYDDTRIAQTLEYLKEVSRARQVVYFTCKTREVETVRRIMGDQVNIIGL
ncbi:MAG: ATP-binding protein [Acetivibrionales bacterium]|jgi:uncharacterized protein YhaN